MEWLRGPKMAIVWTVLRVWLGIQWFKAGFGKIQEFDATGYLTGAIGKATGEYPTVQGWYATFLKEVALPNVEIINFLIPWGEVLVGIGLILGAATVPALLAGAFMNLNFLLAGTLSTNPMLYTVAMILLAAGVGAYYYGVDRVALPYIKKNVKKRNNHNKNAKNNQHRPIEAH
ncbi:thiosulfate dehydrogenase [quinone] large subunit [Bacillus mesophilus]|uniref:DoxX family membrane protein n=1 Tax=Bacillus mesophilus TaxID=1808955 RepID=A0A6M0Q5K5_9BACI|nr:DoxX family membrane protein [Bacillus mesophilus]MBM7659901.1 thiosulfate dehydrogenase [quinone] large subunit [Bacillus mesophilus]NEY70760.1 DoxX family membrane protein [Bacillus mesophilus]